MRLRIWKGYRTGHTREMSSSAQIIRMFRKLAAINLNSRFYADCADITIQERKIGFENSLDPNGNKWEPLKLATIIRKQGAHKTLAFKKAKTGLTKREKGGAYMKNVSASNKRKSAKPEWPLIDTRALMTPTVQIGTNFAKVVLAESRSISVWQGYSISQIHDEIGVGKNRVIRKHWAIYKNAVKRINEKFDDAVTTEFNRIMKIGN